MSLPRQDTAARAALANSLPDASRLPKLAEVHADDPRDAGCTTSDTRSHVMAEVVGSPGGGLPAPDGFGICSGPREPACPNAAPNAPSVWTTLPDTNRCCQFSRSKAPPFSKFPSRAACESWARQRRCRPGWGAFDGCNSYSCSEDGSQLSKTLGDCHVVILLRLRFDPLSSELSNEATCAILQNLSQFLAPIKEKRGIIVKGFVYTGEPATQRKQLALDRARAVKRLLAHSGVPDESMVAITSDAFPMQIDPLGPVVTFEVDPSEIPVEVPRRPPPACSDLGDGGMNDGQ